MLSLMMSDLRGRCRLPRRLSTQLFLIFLCLLSAQTKAHDIDVTGVARVFIDEMPNNQYRLSIVDRQVPPLYNIERR